MSFLDKAKDFLDKHDEQVDQALDKVGDQVDKRTGGKYTSQIDKGVDEAQKRTGAGDHHPALRFAAPCSGQAEGVPDLRSTR